MKIAFVYDAVYPYVTGGGEKRIYEISRRLVKRGHEVHWYGIKWWDGEDVIESDGVVIHGVCSVKSLYKRGKRSIWEAVYFGAKLFGPLRREKFDVIDVGNFPYFPSISAKFVSMLKGTPLVITWHEVWGDYWYEYLGGVGFFGKLIERFTAKLPASHISVSNHTKNNLISLGVPEKKIKIIPNGIDLKMIKGIKPSKEKCDVLFVGRLIREKNIDELIESMEGADFKCCIIGEGPERERLASLARGLGLEKQVKFLGSVEYEEVIARMKAAKVFVLPSAREGFGIVLIEAMACGLPVIAVDAEKSAASEIINGTNGILCWGSELKENIAKVLGDKKLQKELASGGLEKAKGYDWEGVVDVEEEWLGLVG
jgi:glycosyltransferase involved in cell wall biosynthesis